MQLSFCFPVFQSVYLSTDVFFLFNYPYLPFASVFLSIHLSICPSLSLYFIFHHNPTLRLSACLSLSLKRHSLLTLSQSGYPSFFLSIKLSLKSVLSFYFTPTKLFICVSVSQSACLYLILLFHFFFLSLARFSRQSSSLSICLSLSDVSLPQFFIPYLPLANPLCPYVLMFNPPFLYNPSGSFLAPSFHYQRQ